MTAKGKQGRPRVYLAGPEVFLSDAAAVGERKTRLCGEYGFEGAFPLDASLELSGLSRPEQGYRISQANEGLLRKCDFVIANVTPFRGPSADVGTAYELGFARGLGLAVYAYTNLEGTLVSRVRDQLGVRIGTEGRIVGPEGLEVEDFGLVDNLMLDGAVHHSGATIEVHSSSREARYTDMSGFEACLRQAARRFGTGAGTRES